MSKLVKAIVLALAGVVGLVLLVGLGVWIALGLPATREWARGQLEAALSTGFGEPVTIGQVASLGPTEITLSDLAVGAEPALIHAEALSVSVAFPELTPPRLAVSIVVDGPDVRLARESDGRWNVERLAGPSDDSESDQGVELPRWLGRVAVELRRGRLSVAGLATSPLTVSGIEADGRLWVGVLRDSVAEVDFLRGTLGERSALELHGTYELEGEERVFAALDVSPLAVRDLAGLIPDLREDGELTGRAEIEGTLDSPHLRVDASVGDGRIEAQASQSVADSGDRWTASFDVRDFDLAALLVEPPAGVVRGSGELQVEQGLDGAVRALDGQVELTDSRLLDTDLRRLVVKAETSGRQVQVHLEGATSEGEGKADLAGEVQIDPPHRLTLSGEVALQDPSVLSEELRTYFAGSDLRATVELGIADPLAGAPTADLDLELKPGRLRGLPVDGAELKVRLTPELVSLERVWIRADRTNLSGHAWAELTGEPQARSVGGELRGALSLGLLTDAHGVVEADLRFWGFQADLGVSALLDSSGPVELPGFEGTFSSRIDAEHVGPSSGTATWKLTGVFAPEDGLVRVLGREDRATTMDASWTRRAGEDVAAPVDQVDVDLRLGASEATGASLQAVVRRSGERAELDVSGFEIRPVVGPAWELVPPARVAFDDSGVRLDGLRLEVGSAFLEADGVAAGGDGGKNDLSLRIGDLDLADLCELLVVGDECAGDLRANLVVKGPASRPDVRFDLAVDDLSASEQRYGSLRARARTERDALAVEAQVEGGEAGTLQLDGRLPLEAGVRSPRLAMDAPARVDLRTDDLQIDVLRAFAGRSVRRLDGRATTRAELRGSLGRPRLDGSLSIEGLVFAAAATGSTHRDGRVRLEIHPGRIALEELSLDDDAITAGGTIELAQGLPRAFDLWLALDDADVVDRPEVDAVASGKLSLVGPVSAPRLEGDVTIDRATIRPTFAPGGGAPEVDPSVVVVRRYDPTPQWTSGVPPSMGGEPEARPRRPEKPDPRAGAEDPDLYRQLSMMVTTRLGDPVVVRRFDANLRLNGEVYLTKEPNDDLRISGEIGGRRGWYIFQGRRFEIQSAYVTFSGETPLDPYLSVEAQYRTGEYLVQIRITGTAKHPNLDLSSEPPLDQSDILAVVLFGKPASQLNDSQGQVLQSQAFALLASYVAPDLQRSVLDTFGLTSLTFSMPTGDTAGTIGVGRYFGDDLFVSVARDFGGPSGGTDRQLQGLVGSSVTIQYYLTPEVTVQGASSTEGESSMDVIWHRRY